jgi:hypothetical protein
VRSYYELKRKRTYDHPAVFIWIIVVCLLCRVAGYYTSTDFPFPRLFPDRLYAYVAGILLMVGGGYLLYRLNYALVLIREKTFLPFLLFVLLSSTNPDFLSLKASSVVFFCMLLAVYQLFISHHNTSSTANAFKSALLIAAGSLLWVHVLWFIPLFWIGMYNFRCLAPKTFMGSVLGLMVVYWFVLGWAVWKMDFSVFTIPFDTLLSFDFTHLKGNWTGRISLIYTVLLAVIAYVNVRTHEHEDSLRSRQFLSFLMLFLIWALILSGIYGNYSGEFIYLSSMSASVLYAHLFTSRRNRYTFRLFLFTIVLYPALCFLQLWSIL